MEINKYQKIIIPNKIKTNVWQYLNENNIGNRFEFNGNKEQQFVGLVGEIIVKRLFGLHHEFKNGFDGGFDFVYKGKYLTKYFKKQKKIVKISSII